MELHFREIEKRLLAIGERVEGNFVCDIDPTNRITEQTKDKTQNLQYLVQGKKRVCEIGVNAGHSLLLMLAVNPTATYVLFDIGTHRYTRPCVEYIQSAYPDTSIQIVYGDSKETLPLYQGSFDFIHVDGGHELSEVASDCKESLRLIEAGCPIVFDDYNFPVIREFLNGKLQTKEIVRLEDPGLIATDGHAVITSPLQP